MNMAGIINLQKYKIKAVEQKAFGPWQKRFDESCNSKTKIQDFSDQTLYLLAQSDDSSTKAYYELIMGILDFGPATKFNYLSGKKQIKIIDIHLFLVDQIRFEIMKRLKWLTDLPCAKYTLVEMVECFDKVKKECRITPPRLARSHPDYINYDQLTPGDREVFIRRLLSDALETFKKRIEIMFEPKNL